MDKMKWMNSKHKKNTVFLVDGMISLVNISKKKIIALLTLDWISLSFFVFFFSSGHYSKHEWTFFIGSNELSIKPKKKECMSPLLLSSSLLLTTISNKQKRKNTEIGSTDVYLYQIIFDPNRCWNFQSSSLHIFFPWCL